MASVVIWTDPTRRVTARWNKGAAWTCHWPDGVSHHQTLNKAISAAKRRARDLPAVEADNPDRGE